MLEIRGRVARGRQQRAFGQWRAPVERGQLRGAQVQAGSEFAGQGDVGVEEQRGAGAAAALGGGRGEFAVERGRYARNSELQAGDAGGQGGVQAGEPRGGGGFRGRG